MNEVRIWTTLARQPDGSYSRAVTEEQYAWLVRAWCDDWATVYEDWERWDRRNRFVTGGSGE